MTPTMVLTAVAANFSNDQSTAIISGRNSQELFPVGTMMFQAAATSIEK